MEDELSSALQSADDRLEASRGKEFALQEELRKAKAEADLRHFEREQIKHSFEENAAKLKQLVLDQRDHQRFSELLAAATREREAAEEAARAAEKAAREMQCKEEQLKLQLQHLL